MEGVYAGTLLTKMVYSETSAGASQFGENTTGTEHIRLPREVITGNTGLCIELALLHASVLRAAGNHAVIFLIPGHAIPGIKFGNSYYAIESTAIGGQGLGGSASPDQALQAGTKELNDFFTAVQKGTPGYYLLDLDELNNEGYKEMELKDDQFLRQKVDQLAQNFEPNAAPAQEAQTANNETEQEPDQPVTTNNATVNHSPSMAQHRGNISFEYPPNWAQKNHPAPQLPALVTMFASPGMKQGAVEIY